MKLTTQYGFALLFLAAAGSVLLAQYRPGMQPVGTVSPPLRPPVVVIGGGQQGGNQFGGGQFGGQFGGGQFGGNQLGGGQQGNNGGGSNNPFGAYTPGTTIRPPYAGGPFNVIPIPSGYMLGAMGGSAMGQFGGGQFGGGQFGGGQFGGGQFGGGQFGGFGNGFGGGKGYGFNGGSGL